MRATPLLTLAALSAATAAFALPAFPGAEGFGANAKGARASASPTVYRVTHLNDSGPGSLRDAVSASGRVIVFDVGGIIRIDQPLVFSAGLTIAGQTAPGGGITVYGNRVSFSGANNTICRYIRFRMGIDGDSGADAVGLANGSDLIFDHVSASWGRDETFSISGDGAVRITLQDCLIAQGLRIHSAGGLMQTSGGVSIFRTLYADNWMRNPKIKGVNDYVNNVIYNWGSGGGYIPAGDSAGDSYANLINNVFIGGPETGIGRSPFSSGNSNYRLFHGGNLQDLNLNGVFDPAAVTNSSFPTLQVVGARFPYPAPATELSAPAALAWVLDHAGVSHRRDRTDEYVINEVRSYGTLGAFIFNESEMGGIGTVEPGLKAPDTDGDGMPDWWEIAAGTDRLVADATTLAPDGYLRIEHYLNALVLGGVPRARIGAITTDTGAPSTDGVTSDRTLVFSGSAPAGASVALARADTGLVATVVASPGGTWTYDYTGTSLADRVYAFTATATVGGVTSPPSPAFVVTIDNVPAPAPLVTGVTLFPLPTIAGTATPGDTVVVTLAGQAVGTATADELGNWSAPYTGPTLDAGSKAFTAVATDLAGNAGPSSAAYVVDPGLAAPAFTALNTDSGVSSTDRLTNDPTLRLLGHAPAGSTVTISRAAVGVVGTSAANGDGFNFDYTATALPPGTHVFTATATLAGASSPASAPFSVTIDTDAPSAAAIRRHSPATYSTNGGTVVYRVTFAEPVVGVDLGDFGLTRSGTNAGLASLAVVSPSVYDVTVTGVSGDGTVRLNLNSSGTGITDLAGNAVSGGFTSGQTYTVRLAGSGVWINTDSGGLWTDAINWDGGLIAGGSGATANLSLADPTEGTVVLLPNRATLGRLVFGDTDFETPASWTISDGGSANSGISLAGPATPIIQVDAATSQLGDTTDVPAAAAYPQRLAAPLVGTAGFIKTGVGTLELNRPNAQLTGPLTITKGIVQVGPGGTLAPSSVTIATSQQLRVAGGAFSTTGNVSWTSGTGTGVIVSAGTASFQNIVPSNARNSFFRVTGGSVTAKDIDFPRSGDSEAQTTGTGVLISGGDTTFANIGLGTGNSWAGMTLSGGKLTVTGTLHNGYQTSAGRGGVIYLSGGELHLPNASGGLIMTRKAGSNANNVAKLLITGGTANLARLVFGYDSTVTAGTALVTVASPGALYLGPGGIVKNGTSGLDSSITFSGGTLGALASWNTTHPITVTGTPANTSFRAADAAGTPRDLALNGVVSGTGGFAKTGAGTLTLSAANTFTGDLAINAGTLHLTGSLAAGGTVAISSGGKLTGTGRSSKLAGLFAGGVIAPAADSTGTLSASALRWSGGGVLEFNLGASAATSDRLALSAGLSKNGAGVFEFRFIPGALMVGTPYTLLTFATNSGFSSSDFSFTGLGHAKGVFTLNANSLQFTVTDDGVALAPLLDWMEARGLAATAADALLDPDADGVATLLEFVLGTAPGALDRPAISAATVEVDGALFPTIRYPRRQNRGGIGVAVQVADSLEFASPLNGLEVSAVARGDGFDDVVARSPLPIEEAPRQFLRVVATLP